MSKKIIKKNSSGSFEFGQVMSMLENMNSGIQLVSEQHGSIVGRLDKMDGRLDKIQEDIDIVKNDVSKIKNDLKQKVDYDEFEKLEKRFTKVERLVFAKLT